MSEKVIVTGNPARQVVVHKGQHIYPGIKYTMDRADAESYAPDVVILEKQVQNVEVPKPEKREKPADVLPDKVPVEQRVKAAETGRIERTGEKRHA